MSIVEGCHRSGAEFDRARVFDCDVGQNILCSKHGASLVRAPNLTGLDEGDSGPLVLDGLHDYAQVYIDQTLVGVLDRRLNTTTLQIPRQEHASTLDILVENTGRVNYSQIIRTERAGITGAVTVGEKTPKTWEIYSLPMDDLSHLRMLPEPCVGPCFYRGEIPARKPADTYLDTRSLHKGQLWVGMHNVGRFWSVGPQYTLYLPGVWLQQGTTPIVFFDLQGDSSDRLRTAENPIVGTTTNVRDKQ